MLRPLLFAATAATAVHGSVRYSLGVTGEADLFATFDKNADGVVSRDEYFHLGRDLHNNHTVEFITEVFEVEDQNKDGKITYAEFHGPKSTAPLDQVFVALDKDNNGELSVDEYQEIVPAKEKKYGASLPWRKFDVDSDGRLTLYEFTSADAAMHHAPFAIVHKLRLAKLSALINVARDNVRSASKEQLDRIDVAMKAAARMLENGELSLDSDPNYEVAFENDGHSVSIPIAFHLFTLYTKFKLHSIRHLLLMCLRTGADPNTRSKWTSYLPPLLMKAFWEVPTDTQLLTALLNAGASLKPLKERGVSGLSMLHICFHTTEVNIVKKLFIVADQFSIADELDHSRKPIKEIFKDIADSGLKRNDWQGDFYRVEYEALMHSSPTFVDLVNDWNLHGPTDFIDRSVSHAINEEASLANLRLLFDAGVDISEIAMKQSTDGWNPLHLLTHFHFPRCIKLLMDELAFQVKYSHDGSPQTPKRRAKILRALHHAFSQTDNTLLRTPAHFAGAFFGNSTTLQVLRDGQATVERLIQQYDIELRPRDRALKSPEVLRDRLGNTVQQYVSGTASFEVPTKDMPAHFYKTAMSHNAVGGESAIDAYHRERNSNPTEDRALQMSSRTASTSHDGGWGEFFGRRPDLESDPPSRCDIKEVMTMPTKSEWANLVMEGVPFVVRNGAEQLGLRRDLWERENFIGKYGNQSVRVGKIPYQRSFASYVPRDPEYQHNPMDDNVLLSDFIDSFHEHSRADATGIPNYLFGTQFTTDNPSLMDTAAEAFEFAMDVGGINIVFEGQFYLGPPASGAPAHWHSAAINVMAFGEKRWALFPPYNGAFYSIKPSIDFFKWDVPEMEARGQVLHFTQRSGDILCLPKGWGHATLNIETSIGIAFEISHSPTHPSTITGNYFDAYTQHLEQMKKQSYLGSFGTFDFGN